MTFPAVQPAREVTLRTAGPGDLDAINAVVEGAIMSWDLPERVKRLSVPVYRYRPHDLEVMTFVVAEVPPHQVSGVAAWEDADASDVPEHKRGLLLHGLYVSPGAQGRGVGSRLLAAVEGHAREAGYDGVLVKAQSGAKGFFERHGMVSVPARDERRDYAGRFWKGLT